MSDYTPSGTPATDSDGSSADMRAEFALIQTAIASKADSDSPTLTTPALGVATATSINKIVLTAVATMATLTILDSKTLTVNHSLTLAGTDGTTMTFPATSASVARIDAAQTFVGTQTFSGLINANLGLTVAGAAFNSRGVTDNATATALTLSGSGANSVTIANSATSPTLGTSAGAMQFAPAGYVGLILNVSAGVTENYLQVNPSVSGAGFISVAAKGTDADVSLFFTSKAAGNVGFYTGDLSLLQAVVLHTASADRYITLTGSNGGNPTIGTSAGNLALSSTAICAGDLQARAATAAPAGGMAAIYMGTNGYSIGFGSGAPTYVAAKSSLYLRNDGSSTSTRVYVATDSAGAWTYLTTGA